MASQGIVRTEAIAATTTPFIRGLDPLSSSSSAPLNASALALEHILASIARVEARLDASDRQPTRDPPQSRPDPDPPYNINGGWRGESTAHRPVMTSAVSVATQQRVGVVGNSASTWQHNSYDDDRDRSRQPTAWDNPAHRQDWQTGGRQSAWDHPSGGRNSGYFAEPPRYDQPRFEKPRYEKMKPPRFDGSEAANWISRVEYYFEHMGTPENHRLHYVVMMFEGQALEWIFNYLENNPNAKWADFLDDVRRRFDLQHFQNFIGLIAKLCQTGPLAEYNTAFETMLNRVRGVPEYILLPIYVEGLTQPVKNQVRHQHPGSVAAAMALAVEYDSCIEKSAPTSGFQRRSGGRYEQRQLGQQHLLALPAPQQQAPRPPQHKFSEYSKLLVIRLTQAEKAERSRLNLCWYCPEKWVAGHNCRGRFLVYMGMDEDSEDDVGEDGIAQDTQIVTADISHIYAMNGRQKEDAIELVGMLGAAEIRILVDTGSSHDFLHPNVAERLALPLQKVWPFRVYVGNGESLLCSWASRQTRIVIQNHVFLVDLHILPVHGPDVILGRSWLKSLRRFTTDFDTDTLEFVRNGERIRLTLVPPLAKAVSLRQFSTLLTLQGDGEVFELVQLPRQNAEEGPVTVASFPKELPDEVLAVLGSHIGVFGLPPGMPPKRQFDHKIHLLPQSKPVNVRPYRYPYFQKTEIERQVKKMIDSGIIRPSQSPFSSSVLLIRKKDGAFRFCIDYRALNTATVPDNFPIPTTDELFDELGSARFFTKLDLRSGYHQIRMCEEDVYKTAFRTHDGHFEFLVMPFGLTNAPSTFQAAMNAMFRPFLRQFVIVFFDDILIYSPTLPAHVRHLNEVLSLLANNQFFVKLSKCTFACSSVEYLGHIIADGQLKADPAKIEAMMAWPPPTTVKKLRGFLGLTGYYRRFVEHYASIAGH
ncbi:uncharacterized protein LOC125210120 [Salvia hispanica]|uniref:uncharacterized protein LOC125210120 n=1 Tax=Salvia hispanica TaxID=49212 RepID=UPI0020090E8F|nr:uncharacterized protein LOC125210120 [Salvia hispanica]